jgi:hypothetical protein
VVSTTPRPIYPRERPGTHCTRSCVGPKAGLDVFENSRHQSHAPPALPRAKGPSTHCTDLVSFREVNVAPTGIRSSDRPVSSESSSGPLRCIVCFVWLSDPTATFTIYSINRLVFITEVESVNSAVRTGSLYNTDTSRR